MATESLNPFSGYGTIVYGQRFVGRQEDVKVIRDRVLGDEYSNIAITGLPKIGKSSLVWQSLVKDRETLVERKTIVVYYQLGSTRTNSVFFKKLVTKTHDEFLNHFDSDNNYCTYALHIVEKLRLCCDIDEVESCVEQYFRKVRKWGYKIIIILDEFDKADMAKDGNPAKAFNDMLSDEHYYIIVILEI